MKLRTLTLIVVMSFFAFGVIAIAGCGGDSDKVAECKDFADELTEEGDQRDQAYDDCENASDEELDQILDVRDSLNEGGGVPDVPDDSGSTDESSTTTEE